DGMLVGLGRNDLGRVSLPGTVEVSRFLGVERYSHVMHLVSEVTGRLRPDRDAFDGLLSCFPAGTVSGAPKVRAMEIIDELEATRRGPDAGAAAHRPDARVVPPGPRTPEPAGRPLGALRDRAAKAPLLGVCLVHEAIGQAFGGRIARAPPLMHGKPSRIEHDGRPIFLGLP